MATNTIAHPENITTIGTVDEPLTAAEEDTILRIAAASQKPARVPGGGGAKFSQSRAWQASGSVD